MGEAKRQSRPVSLSAAAITLLLVASISMFDLYLTYRSIKSFPDRHVEADRFVGLVYQFHSQKGRWPNRAEVQQMSIPAEWEYEDRVDPTDPASAPMISLHGSYHMYLVYHFAPPAGKMPNRQWIVSFEGSKETFEAQTTGRAD